MFIKNYRKIIKNTLLITTFIAPIQNSFGAEKFEDTSLIPSNIPPIHYISTNRIQAALGTFSEIIMLGKNSLEKNDISMEDKKLWTEKAFSNLKELTDIIRATKYVNKFIIPGFEESMSSIDGWDPITKSFKTDAPFFQLTSKDLNQKLSLSTLDNESIQKVIDSLVLRISKKAMFLEKFQQIGQSLYSLEKEKTYERNGIISLLFEARSDNKEIKNNFTNYVNGLLFKNKKQEEPFGIHKIKLLYTQTETQKKYSDVKLRMESIWGTYMKGLEITNKEKDPQKRDLYKNNIAFKTLPNAMEGLSNQDIRDYFCYLINRNKILKEIHGHYSNVSFIPITTAPREHIQPKPYSIKTNTDLLDIGKSLIENLSKNNPDKPSFDDKITWIANALSMIKLFENDIDKILFDTYLTNPVYTYSSWDDKSQFFTIDPNFKIGLLFPNEEQATYKNLLSLTEHYIDCCILPLLLTQIYQKQWEYMAWIQRERGPVTKKKSKTLHKNTETTLNSAELAWEITHYAEKSQKMMNQINILVQGFTNDIFHYNAHLEIDTNLPYPDRIILQKFPSQNYISCSELINDIYLHWTGFIAESGPLNFNSPEDMRKKNPTVFERLFLEFMKPVLNKYTNQELQLAAASLKHQLAMFTQVNQAICLKIEKNCQIPNSNTKLPAQGKLRHKYEKSKNIMAFSREAQTSPWINKNQTSEHPLDETFTFIQENSKKPHKNKTLPRKGNRHLAKPAEDKSDVKSEKEVKREKIKIQKDEIQLVPLNGRNAVVGKSYPYEPTKKIMSTPQQPPMPSLIEILQPIIAVQEPRDILLSMVEHTESLEQPIQQETIPQAQLLEKIEPVVEKAESQVQPLPVIEKVELIFPPETKSKPITTLAIETPEENSPIIKSDQKPKITPTGETGETFKAKETTSTFSIPTDASKTPTVIQQINYILAHNPHWNGDLFTPNTKVVIPNENVKEIIIQTGSINLYGQNKIDVHVYHHYPETK